MAAITPAILQSLQTGFKAHFQSGYEAMTAKSAWKRIATHIKSTASDETYGWLGQMPGMREWIGDRVIKDIASHGYNIINKPWESTVGVKGTDIEDDKLGIYAPLFQQLGHSAGEQPDRLVFKLLKGGRTELCYDGQFFFDTDHPSFDDTGSAITVSNVDASGGANPFWYLLDTTKPLKPLIFQERKKPQFVAKTDPKTSDAVFMNGGYIYGADSRSNAGFGFWQMAYSSNAPLDDTSLNAAIEFMQSLRNDNGDPLGIEPDLFVGGPKHRAAANRAIKAMLEANGGSNPNYKAVDVLITPWAG